MMKNGTDIQKRLWISELANAAAIEFETSQVLWENLIKQFEVRLERYEQISIAKVGTFFIEKEDEYVAELPDNTRYLIPPRITLCLKDQALSNSSMIADALAEQTGYTSTVAHTWWNKIGEVFERLINDENEVAWEGIGFFEPQLDQAGNLTGCTFYPTGTVQESLDKSFSMFSPIEVINTGAVGSTVVRPLTTLKEATEYRSSIFGQKTTTVNDETEPVSGLTTEQLPQSDSRQETTTNLTMTPEAVIPEAVNETEEAEIVDNQQEDIAESAEVIETPVAIETPESESSEPVVTEPHETTNLIGQTINEPEIKEEKEKPQRERRNVAGDRSNAPSMLLLFASIAVIGIGLYFILQKNGGNKRTENQPLTATNKIGNKSLKKAAKDLLKEATVASADSIAKMTDTIETKRDTLSKTEAITKVKIKYGDSLASFARKFYGNAAFWVYIFEENRAKIGNPDNIPLGAEISIPPAKKYGINALDTNSVKKALSLQKAFSSDNWNKQIN